MASVFLPNVLMQGSEYQQKGYVLSIRLSDGLLKAHIKDRSGQVYDVHIDLKTWPKTSSRCTCLQHNCKHAAASLFALQVKDDIALPEELKFNTGKPLAPPSVFDTFEPLARTETKDKSYQIIYLLEINETAPEPRLFLRFATARKLKRGGIGNKILFQTITAARREFFTEEDKEIMESVLLKSGQNYLDRLTIRNATLLSKILKSQRAYRYEERMQASASEPLLHLGSQEKLTIEWRLALDGLQQLAMEILGAPAMVFFLDAPWYYDRRTETLGPLDTAFPYPYLKACMAQKSLPIALDEVANFIERQTQEFPGLPLPKQYQTRESRDIRPRALLSFNAIPLQTRWSQMSDEGSAEYLFTVKCFFNYEGLRIASDYEPARLFLEDDDTLVEIKRDTVFEYHKKRELEELLPQRAAYTLEKLRVPPSLLDASAKILVHYSVEEDALTLREQIFPQLKGLGWLIESEHPVYSEMLVADELEWFSDLQDKGQDFFSWQLGILIDGKQVSIVPLVVDLISKLESASLDAWPDDAKFSVALPDGKRLQLSMGRIKPLMRFLLQYGTKRLVDDESQIKLTRYQLILLQETEQALSALALRWMGEKKLREQLQQLINREHLPEVSVPKGLKTELRDYQHQGLCWLQFLRNARFGAVLADDMGLGKTIQTLAHLLLEKKAGRMKQATLIVAPTSLVGNWQEEAQRFAPELSVLIFHGITRHQDVFDDYDLVITTYGLVQRDKSRFVDYNFYYLILDEAQFIKNARTKTTQIIQQIKATHRLCLTGTPLENHLGELWSLFHFLIPGLLGDAKQFRTFFKTPIEKYGDKERQLLLAERIRPFMLRRTKNQVIRELPPKTEMTRLIELQGSQRDLYEAVRMSMEKKVRDAIAKQGIGKSHIILLDALLKLRQICCDPKLLSIPEAQIAANDSAKMDVLMELLDNLMVENRRVLVFSQFTSMLKLIQEQLDARHYNYFTLTGQTQNRQQLVNKFQEGHTPIFLISLKAGGTGLNLTRADTVIHYDPWWNPAVEDQATDRTHRIGQQSPVFVYKLITSGTVEEVILAMQSKKRELFDGILSESVSSISSLTEKDIAQFFMPLE